MAAAIGLGVTIGYLTGTTLTPIGLVTSIDMPGSELGEVEITHLGSSGCREYMPTIIEPGEIGFEIFHQHSEFDALNDVKGTSASWVVDFGTPTLTWTGWVKSIKPVVSAHDAVIVSSVVIKCNSDVTVSA